MNINELSNQLNSLTINNNTFLDSKNKDVETKAVNYRIQKWIKKCPYHTFPKSKKAWINTIRAQKNLRIFHYNLRPHIVLNNIQYNKPVARILETQYIIIRSIINKSSYPLIKENYRILATKIKHLCAIIIHFTIHGFYNYMIDSSIIIKRNNMKYYENVSVFIHSIFLPLNRNNIRIFYYMNMYQIDIEDAEDIGEEEYKKPPQEIINLFKKTRM